MVNPPLTSGPRGIFSRAVPRTFDGPDIGRSVDVGRRDVERGLPGLLDLRVPGDRRLRAVLAGLGIDERVVEELLVLGLAAEFRHVADVDAGVAPSGVHDDDRQAIERPGRRLPELDLVAAPRTVDGNL